MRNRCSREMPYALFAAAAVLACLPVAVTKHVLHQQRTESEHWFKRDVLHPHVRLPMRIGLFGDNMDMGHDLLMDISNPDSKNYGKYYSAEDIHDLFAPPKHSVDAVRGWLEKSGIEAGRVSQSTNKQW
jgi:tripeptidyl-peptidase-1